MTTRLSSDPSEGAVRVEVELGSDEPLEQLRALRAVGTQLDQWQRQAIARARRRGSSWSDIGDALGVSKQAAWAAYNDDVRRALDAARQASGLSDAEAQALADHERSQSNTAR
jgi:uncharacterized NAD(P)/FAD-binding protein YdhS